MFFNPSSCVLLVLYRLFRSLFSCLLFEYFQVLLVFKLGFRTGIIKCRLDIPPKYSGIIMSNAYWSKQPDIFISFHNSFKNYHGAFCFPARLVRASKCIPWELASNLPVCVPVDSIKKKHTFEFVERWTGWCFHVVCCYSCTKGYENCTCCSTGGAAWWGCRGWGWASRATFLATSSHNKTLIKVHCLDAVLRLSQPESVKCWHCSDVCCYAIWRNRFLNVAFTLLAING